MPRYVSLAAACVNYYEFTRTACVSVPSHVPVVTPKHALRTYTATSRLLLHRLITAHQNPIVYILLTYLNTDKISTKLSQHF